MEEYRDEIKTLIEADIKAGGEGASISRGILERAGKRIGPEGLLGNEAGDLALIKQARLSAIDPELASSISLTGPANDRADIKGGKGIGGSFKTKHEAEGHG
jgi:hypothetical protein